MPRTHAELQPLIRDLLEDSEEADMIENITTKTADYTTVITDEIINVSTASGAVTITLATVCVTAGKSFTIKDSGGIAGTNNITIATEGSETIDGEATFVINVNRMGIEVYTDGTNWFIRG